MLSKEQFQEAIERLKKSDKELGRELSRKLKRLNNNPPPAEESPFAAPPLDNETIVYRQGRPVLAILENKAQIDLKGVASNLWKKRLTQSSERLKLPIQAVGRIELEGHPMALSWVGTGWLVDHGIVATNRHVAREFARRTTTDFVFHTNFNQEPVQASIDFLEEINNSKEFSYKLSKVLHIEDNDGPDLAFFQIEGAGLPGPISFYEDGTSEEQQVAVIGYPARDSRIPEQDLMDRLFEGVYNKKRLAPGQILHSESRFLAHDCTTLGGNSGSVLLDLDTGNAVGMHFAGRFLQANYAVPAALIQERLHDISMGNPIRRSYSTASYSQDTTSRNNKPALSIQTQKPKTSVQLSTSGDEPLKLTCTIPLHVTIEVGQPTQQGAVSPAPAQVAVNPTRTNVVAQSFPANDHFEPERRKEDYDDREGYQSNFLGEGFEVQLPEIVENTKDILKFGEDEEETILKYEHFSVVMNQKRRMCVYSAVNIDGEQSKKRKRTGWRYDPRISKDYQIRYECYGNAPKYSRGHMTRREDPVWGDSDSATRGNADSMHVTNAVPQMQTFNAGIWLDLEDYALDNARDDDMRISVFTGPIFDDNDPVQWDVKIPVRFFKVIAFIHDETNKLSATGYIMSQEDFIQEFVYGEHKTYQESIRNIERFTGLSFGSLTEHDLLDADSESIRQPLVHPSQIRYI